MRADGAIVAWAASIDPFGISQRHRLEWAGRYRHGQLVSQAYFFFLVVCIGEQRVEDVCFCAPASGQNDGGNLVW